MTLPTLLEAWEKNGPMSDVVRSYRATSLANWEEISLSRRMAGQCLNLYQVLCETFPICVADIMPIFNQRFGYNFPRNEVAKRMSALHCTYKIVDVWGETRHEASGTLQQLYYPLNRMPVREKPLSAKDRLIEQLRDENRMLRLELDRRARNHAGQQLTFFKEFHEGETNDIWS